MEVIPSRPKPKTVLLALTDTHHGFYVGAARYAREHGWHLVADMSGHVITIATFGDEVLGLPGIHSHANGALMWQVDPDKIPAGGSKITLRLRPQFQAAPAPAKGRPSG